MAIEFTGLLFETPEQVAARLAEQQPMPVCAGREVAEKLWDQPPAVYRVESQQRTNMCAVNGGTSVIEVVGWQETGVMVQRSRNWLYLKSQQKCGIYGDRGVTLGSVIRTLQEDGCGPEDLYPFNGMFNPDAPIGFELEAAKCKVTQTLDVRSGGYNSVRSIIGQNIGAVLMATYWPIEYESGYIVEEYQPLGGGGHARAWLFLASKLDDKGRPYVWCANSHSTLAQHNGFELWSPDAVDQQLAHDPWGTTGVTGMTNPAPREVDWTGLDNPFAR